MNAAAAQRRTIEPLCQLVTRSVFCLTPECVESIRFVLPSLAAVYAEVSINLEPKTVSILLTAYSNGHSRARAQRRWRGTFGNAAPEVESAVCSVQDPQIGEGREETADTLQYGSIDRRYVVD